MEKKKRIAGIGELLWDMLPAGKQLGGAPCNFAFHAKQAGADTFVISAVGNDAYGKELLKVLESLGLSNSYIQVCNEFPTGVVDVVLDKNGDPAYNIKESVAWDNIVFNEAISSLAPTLDAVCFGSLAQRNDVSRDTILKFIDATPKDCLRIFDINLRQNYFSKDIILSSLRLSNVLKLNEDELSILTEMLGYSADDSIKSLMKDFDLKMVAYTQGSKGSTLYLGDQVSEMKIKKVKVVDTVGAGDSFTAMMIYGLLQGADIRTIHEAASRLASYVCTCKGATPAVPEEIFSL